MTALDWSDTDLDTLAALSLADIPLAQSWWRRHARRADRLLLESGTDTPERLERALEAVIASAETEMLALADRLASGNLTVADWQTAMADMLRMQTLCAIACARGGWSHITVLDLTDA